MKVFLVFRIFFSPLLFPILIPSNRWMKYMAVDNRTAALNVKISVENFPHLPYKSPKVNERNHLSLLKIMIKPKKS